MFDNKTYNINSPYVNSNTDILYKDRIYDAIYTDNDEFINKIEKTTKKSIKKLLISLNGNTGNIYHYLIILQHDYEEQLIIAFKKIREILNDQILIKQFANSKDQYGNTPFFYLVSYDLNKTIDYFLLYDKDIFNNSITDINEAGKSPLDVYLEKETDYFQMIKNNRENYNFIFSNEFSSVSIVKYKNSLNSVFDTNEKIITNELLYYLQDKPDEFNFIKQIYKNTFNIPDDKELKINSNLNNLDYSNIKFSFDNGEVYRYTDLINDYNKHLSENTFEIDKYFACIVDNKGEIKIKIKNNLFNLFDKVYGFMIKTKKKENIELFNNAIIDTFKNTFNIVETTDDNIKEIFKILKIENTPINNIVKKDSITIKINHNVFDYDAVINNCKVLKILSDFYSNIQTTYNNVILSNNTLTIENNNSSFLSVYAGKLKEKIVNNISNSLKSKYDIDIYDDKINFDVDNLIVYNFVNTVNKGVKLYEYQNLNSLYENYEKITEIISSFIINKSLNNEKLMLKYRKNIILSSCLNDKPEILKDDNIFEIKKYYLSYYLYYYFYLQKNFFNLFIKNFGNSLIPLSKVDTKDGYLKIKPKDYNSTFEILYYIYNVRCCGDLEIGKDSNTKKTNTGYLKEETERYNKNNLIKKIFNFSSFLFFSLDYLFLYNDKTNNNEKTNLTYFLTKDFNFYSLNNKNKDYFPAFFYYQLLYFLVVLYCFKIQLINQRDYSDYIYSSSSSKFNISSDPINQTAIFIYNRLKYIKKSFESYNLLFEFNANVDELNGIKDDYKAFYESLNNIDDEKLFTSLKTTEIQYENGLYFTYKDGKETKQEYIKQLFNYISDLETVSLDIIKNYVDFKDLKLTNDFKFSDLNTDILEILKTGKEEYEKYFSKETIQDKFTDSITINIITPFFIRDYNCFLTIEPTFTNIYNFSGKGDKKTTFKLCNICNRLNSFVVQYNPYHYNSNITKDPYYFYYIKPIADYLFNLKIFSKSINTAIISNDYSISSFNGSGDKSDIKQKLNMLRNFYISNDNIFDYILSLIVSEYKDSKNNIFNFSLLSNNKNINKDTIADFKTLYFSDNPTGLLNNKSLDNSQIIRDSKDLLFSNSIPIYPCVKYYPPKTEDKKINFISHINEFLPLYPVKVSILSNGGLNSFMITITPEKDPEDENRFNSKIQIDYSDLFKGIIMPSSYFSSVIDDADIQIKNNAELSKHIEKIYDFYNVKEEIRNNELMKLNLSSLIDLNQYYSDISNFNTSIIEFINKTKKLLILSIYNNVSDYEIKDNQRIIMNISSVVDVSVLKLLNEYLKDYKLVRK